MLLGRDCAECENGKNESGPAHCAGAHGAHTAWSDSEARSAEQGAIRGGQARGSAGRDHERRRVFEEFYATNSGSGRASTNRKGQGLDRMTMRAINQEIKRY